MQCNVLQCNEMLWNGMSYCLILFHIWNGVTCVYMYRNTMSFVGLFVRGQFGFWSACMLLGVRDYAKQPQLRQLTKGFWKWGQMVVLQGKRPWSRSHLQKNVAALHQWSASKPRNSKLASWLKDSGRDVSRLPSRKSSLSLAQTGKGLPTQKTTLLLRLSDPMINSCGPELNWSMKGCSLVLGSQTVQIAFIYNVYIYI